MAQKSDKIGSVSGCTWIVTTDQIAMCWGSNSKNFKEAVSYQLGSSIKTTYKIIKQNLKMSCYKIQAFQTLS